MGVSVISDIQENHIVEPWFGTGKIYHVDGKLSTFSNIHTPKVKHTSHRHPKTYLYYENTIYAK